ncbi:MAG: aminoacyl-tRNA hydrolase, partial [Gammaproteobacteria bacterium]
MYRLCIIGLGNPGTKYNDTRHNIGKDWLIKISSIFFKKFNTKVKLQAEIAESHDGKILWSIPKNYMNESGATISKILKSTNLELSRIMVIHDDLDLNIGEVRLKIGGGHGGHNGLRDIIKATGHDNFMRIRIGIGHP